MDTHRIHIGTSGWSYKHWKDTFYPVGTKAKDWSSYYRSHFDTVEINSSFYRLPQKETLRKWRDEASDDFVYVLKASRFITHMKYLLDPETSTSDFLEHAAEMGEKLGAILFQLPPKFKIDADRLGRFLEHLPKKFRYAFEFRNATWYTPEIYDLLKKYDCAFCIYELDGHLSPLEVTTDFVYLRLHGPGRKYQGSYPEETLRQWANQCLEWSKTKDVYVYFDNDEQGFAAFNALTLKQMVAAESFNP